MDAHNADTERCEIHGEPLPCDYCELEWFAAEHAQEAGEEVSD